MSSMRRCECCQKPSDSLVRDEVGLHCAACRRWAHEMLTMDFADDAEQSEEGDACGQCDGTGRVDGYEEDPNWYKPGESAPCPSCGGRGR